MLVSTSPTFGWGYIALAALCEVGFLDWFRRSRGNRAIRCAMITFMVLFSVGLWGNLNVPNWLFLTWISTVFLLALATILFFVQRGVQSHGAGKGHAR